jgi:hypothetical protein
VQICFVVVAALGVSRDARAELPAAAVDGVLVLRNGNVLRGAVRRLGDDYRIAVGDAELQVPTDQVEMFALTLNEAYEAKRRARAGLSADSHLELARWCLRHDLLNQAARELLDARMLDPRHSGVAPLVTQLRELLELETVREERSLDSAPSAPTVDEAVTPTVDLAPPISIAAQAQFVRAIQPMLVNGCATGGCHQPGSSQQLQLDRWALHGNGSVELVRRNLSSVLAQLNVDDPPSSALVNWARTAHGQQSGVASRPLAAYQAALLLEWLDLAAGVDRAADEAGKPLATGLTTSPIVNASAEEFRMDDGRPAVSTESSGDERYVPRDAFDPEIFNRRNAETAIDAEDAAIPATGEVEVEEPLVATE